MARVSLHPIIQRRHVECAGDRSRGRQRAGSPGQRVRCQSLQSADPTCNSNDQAALRRHMTIFVDGRGPAGSHMLVRSRNLRQHDLCLPGFIREAEMSDTILVSTRKGIILGPTPERKLDHRPDGLTWATTSLSR